MHLPSFIYLALFFATLKTESSDGYKILGLFPTAVRSHFVMFETLVKGLAKRGHQVDVISSFPLKEKLENYNDMSIEGTLSAKKNNLTFENFIKPMNTIFWVSLIAQDTSEEFCNKLLNHPVLQNIIKNSSHTYNLLITELFFSPCHFAFGRYLNIPIIAISSNALYDFMSDPIGNPMNPSFVPSNLVTYPQKMNFGQRVLNTISTFFMKNTYNYHIHQQNKYVRKYFGVGYPSVYDLQKDVALVLVNSHFTLNGIRPMTSNVIEVGGIHIQDGGEKLPQLVQKWLDDSKSGFIYISFGSMVNIETFPRRLLNSFYVTFKKVAPVRVLMKISNPDELPPGLPKNVKTSSWFPQLQVLKHKNIKAFVTHGGLMGSMESIYCGVPMIGLPLFGDQHTNIYNYVRQKIAISIDYQTITPEIFTAATKTLLTDPTYRNNIRRISKLFLDRPNTSLETAIFSVEYIGRNGNIFKSPAVNLDWWQMQLLDVYGFLLVILLISCYTIYLLLRKLMRFLICTLKTNGKELSEIAKKNK